MKRSMSYSVVIPVCNEQENIAPLYSSLKPVLNKLSETYEIIFVDDGSNDRTFEKLSRIATNDPHVKVIRFRRNFGQSAALAAGFEYATGEIVLSMDGDLQNSPEDIPRLLDKLGEGYDVVCGWRRKRRDPLFTKKVPSRIFNWLASKISGVKLHDFGCTLRAYKKEVVKGLSIYGEMHRYIPGQAAWSGYVVGEVEVSHQPRKLGSTKYGFRRVAGGSLDLLTSYFLAKYFARPMRLFGTLGVLSIATGVVLGVYLTILRLVYEVPLWDRPLLLLAVLLTVLGVQFVVIGLIGEMLTKYRYESGKKFFEIKEKINMDD